MAVERENDKEQIQQLNKKIQELRINALYANLL